MVKLLPKFGLPASRAGFGKFMVALIVLWLVGTAASFGAAAAGDGTLPVVLRAVAYICSGLSVLLVLWGLWSLLVRLVPWVIDLVGVDTVEIGKDALDEAPAIQESLSGLSRTLAGLESDSSRASLLILDAGQYATTLAALIKAIALKADDMREEVSELQAALVAIETANPLKIAQAAGQVRDEHIRGLMLCGTKASGYWQSVARLIAVQLGTLARWAAGYDKFTGNLLDEVSEAKARLLGLSASLELAGVSRPLLQVRANLDEAQGCLQPGRRAGVYEAVKELPAVNAGLLRG